MGSRNGSGAWEGAPRASARRKGLAASKWARGRTLRRADVYALGLELASGFPRPIDAGASTLEPLLRDVCFASHDLWSFFRRVLGGLVVTRALAGLKSLARAAHRPLYRPVSDASAQLGRWFGTGWPAAASGQKRAGARKASRFPIPRDPDARDCPPKGYVAVRRAIRAGTWNNLVSGS
jgi:hypothetical protein